jgi:virulence-associated protein VapD
VNEYSNIRWALERARLAVRQGDIFLAGIMTENAQENLKRLQAKATRRFATFTISLEDSNNG